MVEMKVRNAVFYYVLTAENKLRTQDGDMLSQ